MSKVMTQDVRTTVDAYFAMWNAGDAAARAEQIKKAWVANGRYVDPARDFEGHDALSKMVEAARAHYVGHTIRQSSGIDAHHDLIRFAWQVLAPDGRVHVTGIDVGVLADDGRLQRITGFIGDLPE